MNYLILERAKENVCPICKKEIHKTMIEVEYNSEKVLICKEHMKG